MKNILRLSLVSTLLLATPLTATAHDFWIHPEDFSVEADETASVVLRIGHADDLSYWPLAPDRVIALRSIGQDGVTDHQAVIPDADPELDIALTPGLHILSIETQDAISELPADRFNDYVEKEGVTPIRLDRIAWKQMEEPGIERYSRRGKTLLAVGDWETSEDSHITRPIGLTLELVPLVNPFTLESGETLPLRVYYRGKPQSGVTVKHIRLDETDMEDNRTTNAQGDINVTMPEDGDWMLHAVWAAPLPERADQDYDTIFSSLTYSTDYD